MTLQINRAPLPSNIRLCVSIHHHMWIQTGVTLGKREIYVKSTIMLSLAILKFDRWPWKTTGQRFYATLIFVHRFKAIGKFKPGLQSGNALFWSNLLICLAVWPWNLTNDLKLSIEHLFYATLNFVHRFKAIDEFKRVTLKFDGWHWKSIGRLFCATSSFVYRVKANDEMKLVLQSGNA